MVTEFYDSIFRFWAVGLFVMTAVIILRDNGWRSSAIYAALSSMGGAGYLIISQPGSLDHWGLMGHFLATAAGFAPALAWLFALSQFEDNFRIQRGHVLILVLYTLIWIIDYDPWFDLPGLTRDYIEVLEAAMRLSLVAHMIYVAWRGRADDLLERRRRFRTVVVVLMIGFTGTIVVAETWFRELTLLPEMGLLQAFSFWLFGNALAWYGLRAEKSILIFAGNTRRPDIKKPKPEPAQNAGDPNERHDLRKITELVQEQHVYLEANLTIATFASKLHMPEHRLRLLINQHLGYRNFSDFLNHYRTAEAKARLADVENRHVQVLVIAMDLGYGSLGPFNRAFKERTGQTPTEYRKEALQAVD